MWGLPFISDSEEVIHPLTPEEMGRVPMNDERMHVLTYADNSRELCVDMDPTYLSDRFRRCMRVWYKLVVDPSLAIPFLMGGHPRLGVESPVQNLDPGILRLIVQSTMLD